MVKAAFFITMAALMATSYAQYSPFSCLTCWENLYDSVTRIQHSCPRPTSGEDYTEVIMCLEKALKPAEESCARCFCETIDKLDIPVIPVLSQYCDNRNDTVDYPDYEEPTTTQIP